MLELYLIRHGKSTWNETGRIQGQTDVPLSEEGLRQAEALAQRLKTWSFDAVYSSDLKRASQTAQIALPNVNIHFDVRLREIHLGDFQGRTWFEMTDAERDVFSVQYAGPYHQKVPGGESNDDLRDRALSWLASLPNEGRAVAFSHGGFISSALYTIVGRPEVKHWNEPGGWGFHLKNTSISKLLLSSDFKSIECVGDIAHLENLKSEKQKVQEEPSQAELEQEKQEAENAVKIR
ncbi:MAG: histidine phosphatase family protein [Trueperaceae bacterium]